MMTVHNWGTTYPLLAEGRVAYIDYRAHGMIEITIKVGAFPTTADGLRGETLYFEVPASYMEMRPLGNMASITVTNT